jgi:hypothetical protein
MSDDVNERRKTLREQIAIARERDPVGPESFKHLTRHLFKAAARGPIDEGRKSMILGAYANLGKVLGKREQYALIVDVIVPAVLAHEAEKSGAPNGVACLVGSFGLFLSTVKTDEEAEQWLERFFRMAQEGGKDWDQRVYEMALQARKPDSP